FASLQGEQSHKLFSLAHTVTGVLENLEGCEGTNLFVANGTLAGQTVDHVLLHVIPRYKDDGVSLTWQGKPASQESLQQLQQQIAPQLSSLEQKTSESQPTPSTAQPIKVPSDAPEENTDEPFADF
ncbi:MAG: HIT domain-containing protein, partial [Candidatus Woesearchaeota archaeon]|nr:HIT domain-containing protein [Candidatus Woesearchaeota archaeon]